MSGGSARLARAFYKMSGSGNDFVFFDARDDPPGPQATERAIRAICARRTGVGADGVVFIVPSQSATFGVRYHNRDGSRAALCGNASLCSLALSARLGIWGPAGDVVVETDAGQLTGRLVGDAAEADLAGAREVVSAFPVSLAPGERQVGFAIVGVPHLVVRQDRLAHAPVASRGRELRNLPSLPDGANANFVERIDGRWHLRTYERGVEEETLACGTGAVAAATLLRDWGLAGSVTEIVTLSGCVLTVTLRESGEGTRASLRGEGRLVYSGHLEDVGA